MKKTSVGIVGLGSAARTIHIPALKKLDDVEIVGAYDVSVPSSIDKVRVFGSVEELVADARPEILVIATPPSSHAEIAIKGLLAGCHIFCEKPLTNDRHEADILIKAAREAQRHVVVNSEFPFMTIHSEAKKAMAKGGFGRLLFMQARQSFVVNDQTEAGWRGNDLQRTFKEFGTHVLDLAKFFFDERPLALRARMPKPGKPDGPDYLNIIELSFSGDRVAHIVLDRLARGPHRYLDITLDGEGATIETSIGGKLELHAGLRASTRRPFVDLDVAMGGRSRLYRGEHFQTLAKAPLDLFADGTSRLFRAFLDAIANGTTPPNELEEARQTLDMLYACYECAVDGSTRTLS